MAIRDILGQFSSSQAFTASAVGTNVIDLLTAKSLGSGEPMAVVFNVVVAAEVDSDDEDYTFDVEYASDAAQTTGRQLIGRRVFESGTPTAPAQDADLLVAGFQFSIPIPPVTAGEDEQYLGIRCTVAGTIVTGVTITAYLVPQNFIQKDRNYASGYTVS